MVEMSKLPENSYDDPENNSDFDENDSFDNRKSTRSSPSLDDAIASKVMGISKGTTTKKKLGKFNPENARFPHCITWTPIPCISWIVPSIGHTGIGDTRGVIHDFAGPYYVSVDDFAFGETHKYL